MSDPLIEGSAKLFLDTNIFMYATDQADPKKQERCRAILRAAAFGEGRSLVCVTHAGFIQWLVRATFGCRSWMPLFPTGNCGLFELFAAPSSPGEPAYLQWKRLNFLPAAGSAAAAPSA